MIRKDALIVLITFCLTATLFSIIPVGSQGIREYDPWYDINDDGKIDLKDYFGVGLKYGTEGTAINKTQMLLDLQDRVNALEERQDCVKTIRFYTQNETMNNETAFKDAAVFMWNPRNATNNAMIDGVFYFRYTTSLHGITVKILINDAICAHTGMPDNPTYEMSSMRVLGAPQLIPNQNSYTIKFQVSSFPSEPIYVKDINIVLEVIDGLPSP